MAHYGEDCILVEARTYLCIRDSCQLAPMFADAADFSGDYYVSEKGTGLAGIVPVGVLAKHLTFPMEASMAWNDEERPAPQFDPGDPHDDEEETEDLEEIEEDNDLDDDLEDDPDNPEEDK